MPNLTDVLNNEDELTVEEIALQVCIARDGSNAMGIGAYLHLIGDDTNQTGYDVVMPNGNWEYNYIHGTGLQIGFDSTIVMDIYENAGRFSNRNTGLFWNNYPVLISNPSDVLGADAISNIMSLTQSEYDAIPVKNSSTLYVISGT